MFNIPFNHHFPMVFPNGFPIVPGRTSHGFQQGTGHLLHGLHALIRLGHIGPRSPRKAKVCFLHVLGLFNVPPGTWWCTDGLWHHSPNL